MRLLLVVLLISITCAVLADGCVLSQKYLDGLKETDQLALIDLAHDGPTLDMFIAIDGIPAGKTITYVLPFWHKPEGFTLEEMDAGRFRTQCLQKTDQRITWENSRINSPFSTTLRPAIAMAGATILGPAAPWADMLLCPELFNSERSMAGGSASREARPLIPYQSVTTPRARAELYRVEEKDLQTLVTRANLPEQYAAVLRRYRTNYYAIMRLTGVAHQKIANTGLPNSSGIHYHFRHPMAHAGAYTYTYPLGTGGAWPQPILLTEVYITCPLDSYLQVSAPIIGDDQSQSAGYRYNNYGMLMEEVRSMRYYLEEHGEQADTGAKASQNEGITGTRTAQITPHPSVWHRAYCFTNPTEDIMVHFAPRPRAWLFQIVAMLSMYPVMHVALVLLALLVAWAVAFRCVLKPRWKSAGMPKTFRRYVLKTLLISFASGLVLSVYITLILQFKLHKLMLDSADYFSAFFWMELIAMVIVGWVAIFLSFLHPRWNSAGMLKPFNRYLDYALAINDKRNEPRQHVPVIYTVLFFIGLFVCYPLYVGVSSAPIVGSVGFCVCTIVGRIKLLNYLDGELPKGSTALTWVMAMAIFVLSTAGLWAVAAGMDRLLQA